MGDPVKNGQSSKAFTKTQQAHIKAQQARLSSEKPLSLNGVLACRHELEVFNGQHPNEQLSLDDFFIGRSTPLALKLNDPQYQDYDQNIIIALLQGGITVSARELTLILNNSEHHGLVKYITKENLREVQPQTSGDLYFKALLAPIYTYTLHTLPSEIQAWVVNLACQFGNDAELAYVLERFSYAFLKKDLSKESKIRISILLLKDFDIDIAAVLSAASTSSRPPSSPNSSEAVTIQLPKKMLVDLEEKIKTAVNQLIAEAINNNGRKSLAVIKKIELFEDLGIVDENFSKKLFATIKITTQDFRDMFTSWPKGFGATLLRKGIKLSDTAIDALFYMRSTTVPIRTLVKYREAEIVAWLHDKTAAYDRLQELVGLLLINGKTLEAARFMRVAYPNKDNAAWQQLSLAYQYMNFSKSSFDMQVWQELLTIIDVNVNAKFKPKLADNPSAPISRAVVYVRPPSQSLLFFACQDNLNEAVYTALLAKGAEVNAEVLQQALQNEEMPLKITCLLLLKAKNWVWAENQTAIMRKISSGSLTGATKVKASKVKVLAELLVTDELTGEQKQALVTKLLKNAGEKQKAFKDELHRQLLTANNGTLPDELRETIINVVLGASARSGAALYASGKGGINTDPEVVGKQPVAYSNTKIL